MDPREHRDEQDRGNHRAASNGEANDDQAEQRDELARRRDQKLEPARSLTQRERDERWPIG